MKLYFKQYQRNLVNIPNDGFVCSERCANLLLSEYSEYCEEVNIINTIALNNDGYFDFSKNLIDIGCEYGEYSFILPFNHSYMFDGNKHKCVIAEFNMLLHDKDNYNCYNVLLGDNETELIPYDGFMGYNDTVIKEKVDDITESKLVESKTLDSFNLNNIGLIKVDVEGMEEKVLRGGIGTIIRNNYPPILFELWDPGIFEMKEEIHNSLQQFIYSLGYDILWYWGNQWTHLAIHKNFYKEIEEKV